MAKNAISMHIYLSDINCILLTFSLWYLDYIVIWKYNSRKQVQCDSMMTVSCILTIIVFTLCVVLFVLFNFVVCFVYPILPVFLNCPFVIFPSVFSKVYLCYTWQFQAKIVQWIVMIYYWWHAWSRQCWLSYYPFGISKLFIWI
jgi:hypothetical protein